MATTSSAAAATPPQPAPWRAAFLSHLDGMDSPEFVLSTLHPAAQDATSGSLQGNDSTTAQPPPSTAASLAFLPRARYCIFRGLWTALPENKHNAAPRNPAGVYDSDLPTFTTDVRMNKASELFASSAGKADSEALVQGSGGGGPCEAVWWAKKEMVQWRMRGDAFVVAPDIEGEEGERSSGVRTVKNAVGERMRVLKEEAKAEWSWKTELTAHFGNLSPGMRGTFAGPPPGQPVNKPYDDQHLKLGQKVEDLHDATARANFRVVIIRPQEVESVDLSDPAAARRQLYTYDTATGEWVHQECWP